ncbi:hypothetical protein L7F22_057579 [Adiantum nelumboides]|nr:hypothetical protein [Adiantum nelumboides]
MRQHEHSKERELGPAICHLIIQKGHVVEDVNSMQAAVVHFVLVESQEEVVAEGMPTWFRARASDEEDVGLQGAAIRILKQVRRAIILRKPMLPLPIPIVSVWFLVCLPSTIARSCPSVGCKGGCRSRNAFFLRSTTNDEVSLWVEQGRGCAQERIGLLLQMIMMRRGTAIQGGSNAFNDEEGEEERGNGVLDNGVQQRFARRPPDQH